MQQATEPLGVFQPLFGQAAGNGTYHLTGAHRRVYLKDLLAHKQYRDQERHAAIERMIEDADKAGLYDKFRFRADAKEAVQRVEDLMIGPKRTQVPDFPEMKSTLIH